MLTASRITHSLGSEALTNAGSVAAIVAAAVAVVLLCWGIGRWLWRRLLALDLDHALHVVGGLSLSETRREIAGGVELIRFRAGLELRNGLTQTVAFWPVTFTVRGPNLYSPLVGDVVATAVAPGQQTGWYRDPLDIKLSDLPAEITLDFRINYGRLGGRALRCLIGGFALTLHAPRGEPKPGDLIRQPAHTSVPIPVRDERIQRSEWMGRNAQPRS